MSRPDLATLDVYDVDNSTHISTPPVFRGVQWREVNSQAGSCSFAVPLDEATTADITPHRFVTITWRGGVPFRCRITSDNDVRTIDGREWVVFQDQPGVFSVLNDALIYPEYGLARASGSQRWFGFMSHAAAWYISANWVTPGGFLWSADAGIRAGYPPELKDDDPYWISAGDPYTTVADGTAYWFRSEFTTVAAKSLQIWYTGDDLVTLYLDGEQIGTPDQQDGFSWRHTYEVSAQIQAGDHVLAAKVQNAPLIPGHTNPVAFALAVQELDASGNKTGVLLKTDLTNWKVCTVEPGWAKAQIIEELLDEAVGRGVTSVGTLGEGFDDFNDHDGNPWTDVGEYAFPLGSTTFGDAVTQLSESTLDSAVSANSATLIEWIRRGTDLSGSLELKLPKDGGNLIVYEADGTSPRVTAVLSQLQDGTWMETTDSTGISSYGRLEVGLAAGTTGSKTTQAANSHAQLAESAKPHIQFQAQVSPASGPQPYADFNVGDSFKTPGHRGGAAVKTRLIELGVDLSAEVPVVTLGLVQDFS